MMIDVEICINSTSSSEVERTVSATCSGGAARIELCSDMEQDGLTPPAEHIQAARKAFGISKGLMVMIRPRSGDFCYSSKEIALMEQQIQTAADCGADGVVLGTLQKSDGQIDRFTLERLVDVSRYLGLQVTFHRAFDAVPDPQYALQTLIDCGVDRVLTSGTPWGSGKGAVDGTKRITKLVEQAKGQIEIVIGGGINPQTALKILSELPQNNGSVSLHAYSGVQYEGITTKKAVRALVSAVEQAIHS